MNRVRFVIGTDRTPSSLETFRRNVIQTAEGDTSQVPAAMTHEEAARIAAAAMTQEVTGGCLSDPRGMVADAVGRFSEVPEGRMTDRAKDLCKNHQVEDAKFTIPGRPDFDILIVLHPKKESVLDADGNCVPMDRYVVFAREYGGNGEATMVPGNCYRCNQAEQNNRPVKPHDCFRKKFFPNMVPVLFSKAHGIDDAEDLAKELRSAWSAESEQDSQGWDNHEYAFSGDFIAGFLAARPNAWSTLAQD